MTGDALPVPRRWAAATTSGIDHGGGGAEFRQRRPLGTGAPGAVTECIIGYRVWLGDNCGLRIRIQASDLPGRICVLACQRRVASDNAARLAGDDFPAQASRALC
jgi:hypothetical protein